MVSLYDTNDTPRMYPSRYTYITTPIGKNTIDGRHFPRLLAEKGARPHDEAAHSRGDDHGPEDAA
jgi:hypothetical protein